MRTLRLEPGERTLFAYGTLQPGQGNYWIEPAVRWSISGCVTTGQIRPVAAGSFPIADFDRDGIVRGTLLCMDTTVVEGFRRRRHREMTYWDAAYDMERNAGYAPTYVGVTLPGGLGVVKTLAWHYPTPEHAHPIIESGDWIAYHDEWRAERARARLEQQS